MNQPYTRDGIQSAFVNTSIFDGEYIDALFGGAVFPNGEFMIDHKEGILKFEKWFLEEMATIKDKGRMFTYPVNSISLLKKDGKFVEGTYRKNQKGFGFVKIENQEEEIYISKEDSLNVPSNFKSLTKFLSNRCINTGIRQVPPMMQNLSG